MASSLALLHSLPLLLLLAAAPLSCLASVTVVGSVYCDQCLNGDLTIWGLPLNGAEVLMECKDSNGNVTLSKEGSTNMIGAYVISLSGSLIKIDGCSMRLVGSSPWGFCAVAGVLAQQVEFSWELFGMAMYITEGLFFKPSQPMSFCPNATHNSVPAVSLPPLPFTKLSACSAQDWLNPQYQCYWRVWSPKTKVGVWYGTGATEKYGPTLTLEQGLQGDGEVHRVLLRESIAATLNAFNSLAFYYNAVEVDYHFNQALTGSDKDVLKWAVNFKHANSGYNGKAKCLFTPCK